MKKLNSRSSNILKNFRKELNRCDYAGMMKRMIFAAIVAASSLAAGAFVITLESRLLVYIMENYHVFDIFYDADVNLYDISVLPLIIPCAVSYWVGAFVKKVMTWLNDHIHIS